MKEFKFKSISTQKLKKKEIFDICKLKNTHWRHGVQSQLNWFIKNIKKKDIHNLAYFKNKLVGYGLLRRRSFLLKNKKKNYLYYDTLVVSKKHRKLKIGHQLSILIVNLIKKLKVHSMLISEKKIVPFHKRYKWKKMNKKKSQILDHKYPKKYSMMCFNHAPSLLKNNLKYFVFS